VGVGGGGSGGMISEWVIARVSYAARVAFFHNRLLTLFNSDRPVLCGDLKSLHEQLANVTLCFHDVKGAFK
jgi:hypothetical protein